MRKTWWQTATVLVASTAGVFTTHAQESPDVTTAFKNLMPHMELLSMQLARTTDCNDPHASAEANRYGQRDWESGTNPVYTEATNLSHELGAHGLVVQCIRRSLEENRFHSQGQKGAAWFKTTQGVFNVWFMSNASTAAAVTAIISKPGPNPSSSRPSQIYLQEGDLVFHLGADDADLAASIRSALKRE